MFQSTLPHVERPSTANTLQCKLKFHCLREPLREPTTLTLAGANSETNMLIFRLISPARTAQENAGRFGFARRSPTASAPLKRPAARANRAPAWLRRVRRAASSSRQDNKTAGYPPSHPFRRSSEPARVLNVDQRALAEQER